MQAGDDWQELAGRVSGALRVTLYWRRADDATGVEVVDEHQGETAFVLVPGDCALDAFRDPTRYLRAPGGRDRWGPSRVDVDEAWVAELAAAAIADLAALLARRAGPES